MYIIGWRDGEMMYPRSTGVSAKLTTFPLPTLSRRLPPSISSTLLPTTLFLVLLSASPFSLLSVSFPPLRLSAPPLFSPSADFSTSISDPHR